MMTITGYFDASGTQEDEHVLVAAGAVTDVDDWIGFDEEWLACRAANGVKHFRMEECAHFMKDFAEWRDNEPKRKAFLGELVRLTNEHVQRLYVSTLVLSDYKRIDQKYQATEVFGGAYSLAAANSIFRMFEWLHTERAPDDAISVFVERGDIGQDGFRRLMESELGELADTVQIIPKRDPIAGDITPFDVPDFVAYEYRSEHAFRQATGKLKDKPRGLLSEIRKMLYPKVGVMDYDSMERACVKAKVPLR